MSPSSSGIGAPPASRCANASTSVGLSLPRQSRLSAWIVGVVGEAQRDLEVAAALGAARRP